MANQYPYDDHFMEDLYQMPQKFSNRPKNAVIEIAFLPFLQGKHPSPWVLTLVLSLNIAYWTCFIIWHRHEWDWVDYAAIWIIPALIYLAVSAWDKVLKEREWSAACRFTFVILHEEVGFWLMQQWTLNHLKRPGNIAASGMKDLGEDFAGLMDDHLEYLPGWLRYKLRLEFQKIQVHSPLGTTKELSNRDRTRLLAEIHEYFVDRLHGRGKWKPWALLGTNLGGMIFIW